MKQTLDMGHVQVLPNGVNLDLFKPSSKATNQQKLGWDTTKQHILFPSDPSRPEKNFDLLKAAYESLNDNTVILHYLKSIDHSDIPDYLNASDVIVLPSLWEGSPNSVKEAMACSRPIICTNIGDVKWLFNNLEGHYLTDFNVGDLANKIKVALKYSLTKEKTLGREQIERLGLSSKSIAQKLINIYEQYIQKR